MYIYKLSFYSLYSYLIFMENRVKKGLEPSPTWTTAATTGFCAPVLQTFVTDDVNFAICDTILLFWVLRDDLGEGAAL